MRRNENPGTDVSKFTYGDVRGASLPRRLLIHIRDASLFTGCYIALDWTSYIYPLGPFNITPWNPQPALCIVWLMLGGLRHAPLVFIAALGADLLVRGAPGGVFLSALTSLILAGGYTAITWAWRRLAHGDPRLRDTRQLWLFIAVACAGAAVVAVLYVGALWGAGFMVKEPLADAVFHFWLGDALGMAVTVPLFMVAADAAERTRLIESWRKPETLLQFAIMVGAVFYIFKGTDSEPARYFYLLFLPLIWIALRGGLVGAVLASVVVQLGVVLGAHESALQSVALVELQALVAALTLTGLSLGVMVDERERATEGLKRSLRLAAAGEMAGAIAHEINQPLAALANYGRACQLMLEERGRDPADDGLHQTLQKMLGESRRAASVVGRLRDFFTSGSTRLERVKVADLLAWVRQTGERLDPARRVAFDVRGSDLEAELLIDRLQIELVLRNLITNAFEAVAPASTAEKAVSVTARAADNQQVVFRVTDSGAGVPPADRALLFQPFFSSKAAGMGLGLAISRSIAEAHGGTLDALLTGRSEFRLSLPRVGSDA